MCEFYVQKNENFAWTTTGFAVRVGQSHTITSNLHGGGKAIPFQPFIEKHYPNRIEKIQTEIKTITSSFLLGSNKTMARSLNSASISALIEKPISGYLKSIPNRAIRFFTNGKA